MSCALRQFSKGAFIRTHAHCHNVHVGDTAGLSMTPTPRRPLLQAAACTDATLRPRRGHRRTTCRTSRSAQSPDDRTAHHWATRPDTSAPAPRSCRPFLPSTRLRPPFYAQWSACSRMKAFSRYTSTEIPDVNICSLLRVLSSEHNSVETAPRGT